MLLEEELEPILCPDSYGYRPGRSAHGALAVARKRCWSKDWVLDLDVRAFFDSVGHDLLMRAVAHHTDERWVLLCIERWLKAPMTMRDGTDAPRETRTPQGSPISPLLANLFMHYAFDKWMDREHPGCPFERYADDVVVHCDTEQQARQLGPARLRGIEGCWHRLGSLCHEDAAGFEVGGVGEAVGAAPEHLEQVVGALDSAVGGPVAVVPGEDLV